MAYEESNYTVVHKADNYQIRYYDERIVIQTRYTSGSSGFRKLFNYISGQNQVNQKIEMTTPVTELKEGNQMVMQFYLPSRFDTKSVPLPDDLSLEIATIQSGYYAVIQYSGFASDNNFLKHANILKFALDLNEIKSIGPPIKATYDGPFTLPNLRRNEAMYLVSWN